MSGKLTSISCLIVAGAVSVEWCMAATDIFPPVDTKTVEGTTVAKRPELAGVVQSDELIDFEIKNATGKVVFAGKVQDRVVLSDLKNTLDFSFRIRDTNPGLSGRIKEVRREGFKDYKPNMDFRLDGLGTLGPNCVYQDKKGRLGFSFDKNPIAPSGESRFCFAFTDAVKFDAKAGSLVIIADDGSSVTLPVAAPKK